MEAKQIAGGKQFWGVLAETEVATLAQAQAHVQEAAAGMREENPIGAGYLDWVAKFCRRVIVCAEVAQSAATADAKAEKASRKAGGGPKTKAAHKHVYGKTGLCELVTATGICGAQRQRAAKGWGKAAPPEVPPVDPRQELIPPLRVALGSGE
jgi:hypothetical protein